MKLIALVFALLVPVAAMASPAVRAACPMGCCGDTCPTNCPLCAH